jgi:hypothetical protein
MSLIPASRAWRSVVLLAAAAGLVWLVVWYFNPNRSLLARQEKLIEWVRAGSPSEFADDFAASDYSDQWGHTAPDVVLQTRAIRLAHPGLTISAGPPGFSRDGDNAIVIRKITVTGAEDRIETDFHFTWHKENLWPWSWRLKEVTAPGLR